MIISQRIIQSLTYLLALLIITPSTNGYRILGLFPHPGQSHFQFFQPIMYGLAEAGHNVTVVSHFADAHPPPNYKDIPLSGVDLLTNTVDLAWFANRNKYIGHFMEFFLLHNWGIEACDNIMHSDAIRKVLKMKEKFDVIIIEQFNTDCLLGITWKLKAPVIGMSSSALMPWYYDRIGNPIIPSYMPAIFMGYSDKMSYVERLANWVGVHVMKLLHKQFMVRDADKIIRSTLGTDVPSVAELAKKTSLIFVNQHYSLSGAKPLSPALIELGGIHIAEAKQIDEKLQKVLDSAENGVIYVSWGSMIRAETLPPEKRDGLLKAFSTFKQKIFWKWENETLANQPKNVFIQKWLPQRDILCHPKVRVFITHGGLLGSSEAAYCGVPVVVTPMYGDQFLNAAALVDRGMGRVVHYEDISKETMTDAIRFALEPATQENARKVSYSYRNRIQTPKQTAVWWVEHVAETGGAPLTKSHSTFMPAISYYCLDIYGTLSLGFSICIGSWIWVLKRFCCGSNSAKMTKVKTH